VIQFLRQVADLVIVILAPIGIILIQLAGPIVEDTCSQISIHVGMPSVTMTPPFSRSCQQVCGYVGEADREGHVCGSDELLAWNPRGKSDDVMPTQK